MGLEASEKQGIITQHKRHAEDTGSPEVQVALLTKRIDGLGEHLKLHNKDFSSRRGLLRMVGKRKRLLRYLMDHEHNRYGELIKVLGLRK